MKNNLTIVTRKGQITLPVAIRRLLGIKVGDKVAVSLVEVPGDGEPQVLIRPVRSVAEMTFGAVPPLDKPLSDKALRRLFEDSLVREATHED